MQEILKDDDEDDEEAGEEESQPAGRDVHVLIQARTIASFVDQTPQLLCFRCGEAGHLRNQCLTFRVKLCSHFQSKGSCREEHCTFAHGEGALRTPWKVRCVRVIKHGGRLVSLGCNSNEHTFRRCPLHQDLIVL